MKGCLKSMILAGATATAALAFSGCASPDVIYVRRLEPSPIIVERHYPLGYPVIEYRVYPHYGFHNPHREFRETPHYREVPRIMPQPMPLPRYHIQPQKNHTSPPCPRH